MGIWRIVLVPVLLATLSTSMGPAQAEIAPKRVLVELREQGGFAGLNDRVIVYGDGCARLTRRTGPAVRTCLTAKERRTLRGHLGRLKLGRSQPPPRGADFIAYTLVHDGRRVTAYSLPATWRPVVRHLEKIMARYRTSG
ncbi:hypothetical protein FAF44_22210 [Nonomuraea sp. MG754425]|uniref:hypothetical protein n=1 Tax=Nonomuraea sp. MG754425 TaxID=2570319 RepID=UPI001F42698F|nr:hypothetical protein [Nonomuraea sp. MG754425]MCF6471092.1 hypothetical protein [Nonomuraea sp. MG754425]